MIAFLRGTLVETFQEYAVVDVQGVGYQVRLGRRHLQELQSHRNQEVTVPTHLIHREDSMELFGFQTQQERELFALLLGISGIGARTALNILSELSWEKTVEAIATNQPRILASVPGIGQKTAQRVILELKDKLSKWHLPWPQEIRGSLAPSGMEEVEMTLLALGYTPDEIYQGLEKLGTSIHPGTEPEVLIRQLLEQIS